MVINTFGLICFVIWLIVVIITAIMAAHGKPILKMTIIYALLVVLMHFFEKGRVI